MQGDGAGGDSASERARRSQENADRRKADARIVEALARDGFQGPRYDRFVDELVRYAISVLCAWMRSGLIFELLKRQRMGLVPRPAELEALSTDADLRQELANMTVARALARFRTEALVNGGWTPEGGARLTTYFTKACLVGFPNEFRRHFDGERRHERAVHTEKYYYPEPAGGRSAADEALGRMEAADRLKSVKDPKTRAAVILQLAGFTQEEIRELLDLPSVRAVEGLIYRWRAREKRGGSDDRDE